VAGTDYYCEVICEGERKVSFSEKGKEKEKTVGGMSGWVKVEAVKLFVKKTWWCGLLRSCVVLRTCVNAGLCDIYDIALSFLILFLLFLPSEWVPSHAVLSICNCPVCTHSITNPIVSLFILYNNFTCLIVYHRYSITKVLFRA